MGMMKDVPEEEEDECEGCEGEVWSSRTDPVPKIPTSIIKQASLVEGEQVDKDDAEEEEYWDPEDYAGIPKPPDGGWGWVIVAASFFCNVVVDGIAYSFGIFLIHFVRYYQTSKGETAWVGSLLTGCYLLAGPVVSGLTNKFGCRPVTIAGSIISSIAFLLSTIAPNVKVLMVTYGIMGGIGFGLIYLPAIVSVGYYFSTKRAFATGLAVCGSGMGAFVFAPITQMLLDTFDWKGALVILAGFNLNCMVFGALMRPLKANPRLQITEDAPEDTPAVKKEYSDSGLALSAEETLMKLMNNEPGVQSTLHIDQVCSKILPKLDSRLTDELHNSVDAVPAVGLIVTTESSGQQLTTTPYSQATKNLMVPVEEMQNSSLGALKENVTQAPPKVVIKTSRSQMNMKDFQRRFTMPAVLPVSSNVLCPPPNGDYQRCSVATGRDVSWSGSAVRRKRIQDRKDLARPLYRKDIFYSGSIVNLPEFQNSRNDVHSYVASVTSIPYVNDSEDEDIQEDVQKPKQSIQLSSCCRLPKSMMHTLKEVFDFSLLRYPPFLLACVGNVFGMMGFYIPFVYLTDSSVMKGIDRDRAAFLISILGVTNLFGRLIFGWLVDRPKVRALDVNNICVVVSALATFFVPFCFSYASIVAAASIFSLFVSAYISLTSIILVDMVGLDKLTNSFGLLSLFRGAASIIGPPMAGTVFDVTGSYDIPFYLAGGLLLASAGCTFFIPWLTRCGNKTKINIEAGECSVAEPEKTKISEHENCSDTDSGKPESIGITAA